MSDIICGQCPYVYGPREIDVYLGDDKVAALDELRAEPEPEKPVSRGRKAWRTLVGLPPDERVAETDGPNLDLRHLRPYTFRCPKGHAVDGNAADQFPIAVLGGSGASKSHVLPGLISELDDLRRLSALGVSLSDALYADPKLKSDVSRLYRLSQPLPPTPPGQMLGPFGYKLTIGAGVGDPDADQYSLLLFDIAGEDLGDVVRVAQQAPFMVLSKGLIVLLDPVGFLETQFDDGQVTPRSRQYAARDVRQGVRVIADTLAAVWKVRSSRELSVPICFAVAKADAVEWGADFEWSQQTQRAITAARSGNGLSGALLDSSAAAREALIELGGELVVAEIEERFDPARTRFAALSATSTMPIIGAEPEERQWVADPEPNGIALSFLQILDLADVLKFPGPAED